MVDVLSYFPFLKIESAIFKQNLWRFESCYLFVFVRWTCESCYFWPAVLTHYREICRISSQVSHEWADYSVVLTDLYSKWLSFVFRGTKP